MEVILLVLMETLVHQKNRIFAGVYIIMVIDVEAEQASLNVYDFSVDYDTADKSDILNFYKYFRMVKNKMK